MSEYSDLPQINILYQEREIVTNGIAIIDDGGNLTNITLMPASTSASAPQTPMIMPAMISLPPPTPADTLANIRAWLVQRQADIDAELAALDVTNPPAPAAAQAPAKKTKEKAE